jgi:hypothetical protein
MDWLANTLVALVVGLLLAALARAAKKPTKLSGGVRWLKHPLTFRAVSTFMVLLAAGLVYVWFNVEGDNKLPVFLMAAFLGLIGGYLLVGSWFEKIGYDDTTVYYHTPWGRSKRVKISELGQPRYSKWTQCWIVTSKTQGKLRFSYFMCGTDEFLKVLRNRTSS